MWASPAASRAGCCSVSGIGQAYLLEEDAALEAARRAIRPIPTERIECYRACHFVGQDPIVLQFVNAVLAGL